MRHRLVAREEECATYVEMWKRRLTAKVSTDEGEKLDHLNAIELPVGAISLLSLSCPPENPLSPFYVEVDLRF